LPAEQPNAKAAPAPETVTTNGEPLATKPITLPDGSKAWVGISKFSPEQENTGSISSFYVKNNKNTALQSKGANWAS